MTLIFSVILGGGIYALLTTYKNIGDDEEE